MDFPKIRLGQFAVLQAELATGIVLKLDGERCLGSGESWLILDFLDEATAYSNQKVSDVPEIECNIYNHLNEHIPTISCRKNEPFCDSFSKIRAVSL